MSPTLSRLVFTAVIIFIIKSYSHWAKGWKCLETEANQVSIPHPLARTSRGWLGSHERWQAEPERHPGVGCRGGASRGMRHRDKAIKALMGATGLWGQYPVTAYVLYPWEGEGNSQDDWSLPRRQILRGHQSKLPRTVRRRRT